MSGHGYPERGGAVDEQIPYRAAVPSAAWATTVPSPIGAITVVQHGPTGGCDDFGAFVEASTAGGAANTVYTVVLPGIGGDVVTATFTTNAAGAGGTGVKNTRANDGKFAGEATGTVSANGTTVSVDYTIDCDGGKG
jgi:hypothetical protein